MTATFAQALQHHQAGRTAEAVRLCRELVALEPGNPGVLNLLGVGLFTLDQAAAAVMVLTRAIRLRPGATEIAGNLAELFQAIGDPGAAAAWFRYQLVFQPENGAAYSRWAALQQRCGDLTQTADLLRRAMLIQPQAELERLNFSLALVSLGKIEAADKSLRRLIALNPGHASAYIQLGEAGLRLGQLAPAEAAFKRAYHLAPADASAANGLARCQAYRVAQGGSSPSGGGIVVRGVFTGVSGYGHMTRRFLQTLRTDGIPLNAIGLFGSERWPEEDLMPPVPAAAVVNFLIPLAVERIPGLTSVLFSMFEGTRIPPAWRRLSDLHDLVVVPTESSRVAWAAQGYPEAKLRVCPLGVDADPRAEAASPLPLITATGQPVLSFRHRFLNVSDFIPRKNADGLLRVWLRSTRATDDAVLILKLGKGGAPTIRANFDALVRETEAAVGKRLADSAPVVLVDVTLDEAAMTSLFRSANWYWSLSHGEGWDLPLSKAGAMGLGLIAPRHSAYLDYLDDRVARLIPAVTGPAHRPYSREPWPPFFGLDWWEPDEDAAADIIHGIVADDHPAIPDARSWLLEQFTWQRAARRLRAILNEGREAE